MLKIICDGEIIEVFEDDHLVYMASGDGLSALELLRDLYYKKHCEYVEFNEKEGEQI